MYEKISGVINIARKGNFLVIGLDRIKADRRRFELILIDEDAGENLKKESRFFAEKYKCECFAIKDLENVSKIRKCKILTITNFGLAKLIIDNFKSLTNIE